MQDTLIRHIDNVMSVGLHSATASQQENLFYKSWARCMKQHGLDPSRPSPARILPSTQLREHQQRMDGFLRVARAGMEDMYRRVADMGYMLLLTDADGVTVDYIGNPASEQQLKAAGLYLGADWNEAHAGTCGVGTCLVEQKTITCHQNEHFDATHIALTCTSSPLFAPDGNLLGVLDVSALRSPQERESQHLVFHLTTMYAQMIEDANFLRHFSKHWILRLGKSCGLVEVSGEVMFAFDDNGMILGANTGARRRFGGANGTRATGIALVGRTLEDVVGLSMDSVWGIARGGAVREVSGLWTQLQEHYYPAVIPPRNRPLQSTSFTASFTATTPAMPGASHAAERVRTTEGHSASDSTLDLLSGDDERMQHLLSRCKRLVDRGVSLLILGETGSGKEVLAKALHGHSARRDKPFIAVNCASIPESLIESELFGYTPGSFTGGKTKGMKGLIAQSDGGTLFLDEIGDMPLHLQTRLLRVLAEQEVLPLGAERPIPVQLSVVAATHRDLRERVEQGTFREDLYYRLSGAVLALPALRERQDRPYLIDKLCTEEAQRLGLDVRLSDDALQLLLRYPWPGNVRELRNAMRYAVAICDGEAVQPEDLPAEISQRIHHRVSNGIAGMAGLSGMVMERVDPPLAEPAEGDDLDATRLQHALKQHKWNITSTAQSLGVCRATIYRQMKRLKITPPHLL